jgi:arylsulfatase
MKPRSSRPQGSSETCSPVTDDYRTTGNEFSGEVNWVQMDLGEDAEDADHYIKPGERLAVAMTLQ